MAQSRAREVRYKQGHKLDQANSAIKKEFRKLLKRTMPPEWIAQRLTELGFPISKGALYAFINKNGLRRKLPRRGKKSQRKKDGSAKYQRIKAGYKKIKDRPDKEILKEQLGHIEIDMVMSVGNKDGVLSILEIKTNYYTCYHMSSKNVDQLTRRLKQFIQETGCPIRSITCDQGVENMAWPRIEKRLNCPLYYCNKASPWQRGSNERFNGVLRRYFPKGTDFKKVTAKRLKWACESIQMIPLKILGKQSPKEMLERELKRSGSK